MADVNTAGRLNLVTEVLYFGQPVVVGCDAQCWKAWGINQRPRLALGADPDDYAFLADDELREAPADPGTYEGGHAKPPNVPPARHNKWCVRECERSAMVDRGESLVLPDFSRRLLNCSDLHPSGA